MRRLWVAALLFALAPAAYGSDQIRIVDIGLHGYYADDGPARLRVAVLHPDPRPADVQLRVLVHNPLGRRVERVDTYFSRVALAPNDRRIIDLPVLLRFTPNATIEVQELDALGKGITEDTRPLEISLPAEFLIALVCSQPAACQQIQSQISFSGNETGQTYKGKVLRFATVDDPPEEFWGYSPARTVILARPLASLSPAQQAALEAYIRQGYALIVLQDLAPDAGFLSSYRPASPAVTATSMGEGRITWVPSLASGRLGDLYASAALPYAVLGWEQYGNGTDILSWVRKRVATHFQFPTLLWLVVWLAAYLLIAGIGNFVLLRMLRRPEWSWVTLPCISILFAAAMYVSSAVNRPHELRGDDVAVYWMDEKSPVAFVERGIRVSSNRRRQVQVGTDTDEVFAGDRNNSGASLTLNILGDQTGQNPLNHWDLSLGPPRVDLNLLQWSFRDLEFVGPQTQPGTVRRVDGSHFRNETGRSFRQALYLDSQSVYFFGPIPAGSVVDLAAASSKKPLAQATRCWICARTFPTELANAAFDPPRGNGSDNAPPVVDPAWVTNIAGISRRPFDLSELILAWPGDAGHALEARSGVFFGFADESHPSVSIPGKAFVARGYSLTVVSYEPRP